jgi:hypothetical protein
MHMRLAGVVFGLMAGLGCEVAEGGRGGRPVEADGGSLYQGEPAWCGSLKDVSDLADAHRASDLRGTVVALMERRYPPGVAVIDVQTDEQLARWFSSPGSFPVVFREAETAVHEGTHLWGFDVLQADVYSYRIIDDDLVIATTYHLDSFGRGEILSRHPDPAGDMFAEVYLDWTGDQGFSPLLDEFNAYVQGLAAMNCTRDSLGFAQTSSRRAVFTFQFYVTTYLAIAREEHPADYDAIVNDLGTRSAILTIWDRSVEWLERTEGEQALSLDEAPAKSWVRSKEIDRLR